MMSGELKVAGTRNQDIFSGVHGPTLNQEESTKLQPKGVRSAQKPVINKHKPIGV
jgi:hypothetical protein